MAEKLVEIYEIVTRLAGFKGRMRLAVRTGVSRVKAQEIADTSDRISKFKKEASEIIGQDIAEIMGSEMK